MKWKEKEEFKFLIIFLSLCKFYFKWLKISDRCPNWCHVRLSVCDVRQTDPCDRSPHHWHFVHVISELHNYIWSHKSTVYILKFLNRSVLWSAGFLVNVNDIAGPYSGIVFGISNTFATITGIVSPYVVGVLTKNVREFLILREKKISFI